MTHRAAGDSITVGAGASSPANAYLPKLAAALSVGFAPPSAVSGHQAADQSAAFYGVTTATGDKSIVLVGTNDHWKYGTSSAKRTLYKGFLTGLVVRLAAPARVRGLDVGMSYTGTWGNTQVYGTGKNSSVNGATASATVSGTAVYIGTILQDIVTGTADVRVDGVLVGSVTSNGAGMNTQHGATYAPGVFRFGGLSAGSHTVQLTITSPSGGRNIYYNEAIIGSDQLAKPKVYLGCIPRMTATGYASLPGQLSSDDNVAAYNDIVSTLASDLVTDGMDVTLVDAALNPATDLAADGIHPNDAGHLKLKNAFYTAMTGSVSMMPVSGPYLGSDGNYYIGDGSQRRRIACIQ